MDRLKREWEETEIPEEVRLRARNLAWAKIQHRGGGRKAFAWATATSTVAAMTVLIWFWSGPGTYVKRVAPPAPRNISRPAVATSRIPGPVIEIPVTSNSEPAEHALTIQPDASIEGPERIVLNFRLPESGARMIWIMDSSFNLNGGVE